MKALKAKALFAKISSVLKKQLLFDEDTILIPSELSEEEQRNSPESVTCPKELAQAPSQMCTR